MFLTFYPNLSYPSAWNIVYLSVKVQVNGCFVWKLLYIIDKEKKLFFFKNSIASNNVLIVFLNEILGIWETKVGEEILSTWTLKLHFSQDRVNGVNVYNYCPLGLV